MIVDKEAIHSKPQEIIKKLLRCTFKQSANNKNFQPLKGA